MEKIAIITDSASDVSVELLKEYNITLLPFRVFYKDKEYADRIELTPDMMYERLEEEIPKTSLPSTELIISTLDRLAEEPVEILVNGKRIAYGEVVVVDENFGVRITSIVSGEDRIKSLSK